VDGCAVKAPGPAQLVGLQAKPGMTVTGGQVLATLEAAGGPRLAFAVDRDKLAGLKVGQQAEIKPTVGSGFLAAISQLMPEDGRALVYLEPLGKVSLPAPGTALVATLRGGR
jgi:hypothetical protein